MVFCSAAKVSKNMPENVVQVLNWPGMICCFQVVANIPFNISTDVIKLFLPMGDIFSEVVLLLQVRIDSSLVSIIYCLVFSFSHYLLTSNISIPITHHLLHLTFFSCSLFLHLDQYYQLEAHI